MDFWSHFTNMIRDKFNVSIDQTILPKIHLNQLVLSILDKLNVKTY